MRKNEQKCYKNNNYVGFFGLNDFSNGRKNSQVSLDFLENLFDHHNVKSVHGGKIFYSKLKYNSPEKKYFIGLATSYIDTQKQIRNYNTEL